MKQGNEPVVVVAESIDPDALARLGEVELRFVDGTDAAALKAAVADADALLVRSGTHVSAEVIAAASKLRVVARAGVGLDNIDVMAATQAGVMVVNAPDANVISAAELTVGLALATARHISAAHAALQAGEWDRDRFVGTELHGLTAGLLGLGRVGVLVAQRLAAFGMKVVAYDPYVQAGRAAQLGVRMVPLGELVAASDILSVHLPRTSETVGLLGAEELANAKPSMVLINTSRGGIVEEDALYAALSEGRLAGAGLDVFTDEPATDSPLLGLPNVVATPHIGAITHAGQAKAGHAIVRSVALALAGEVVPDAVNVKGGAIAEDVRPGLPLTEKLGQVLTALAGEVVSSLGVEVRGEIARHDVRILELAALKGLLTDVVPDRVGYVNAPILAAERGVGVSLLTDSECPDHRNLITLRGIRADGSSVSVSATLVGISQQERLVEVDGYAIDVDLTDHLAFMSYPDMPGMIGRIGGILGDVSINIAGMQVSRDTRGGNALVALSVDTPIPHHVATQMREAVDAELIHTVDLRPIVQ